MTIYDLKPAFQRLLRPTCRQLAAAGVTANLVTVTAMLVSLTVGAVFAWHADARWAALLIPTWLLLRMACNAIDGMLAREHHMQSALGGFLNELSDVVSDAALYLPFAMVSGALPALVVLVVMLSTLTEMAGVVAVQVGASRRYDGPLGKSDRAFVFGLLGLLLALGVDIAGWLNPLLCVLAALLMWTVLNRCRRALREVNNGHESRSA